MHKSYFIRKNVIQNTEWPIYRTFCLFARLYLFPAPIFSCEPHSAVSDRAPIVQCLQTSKRNWLLPELPLLVLQGEVLRAAQAPQPKLLFAQLLCSICLTDTKAQIGFQWIRVA